MIYIGEVELIIGLVPKLFKFSFNISHMSLCFTSSGLILSHIGIILGSLKKKNAQTSASFYGGLCTTIK